MRYQCAATPSMMAPSLDPARTSSPPTARGWSRPPGGAPLDGDPGAAVGQPIICKAAVAFSEKKPLEVVDVVVDAPGPGEARVQMTAASVCPLDVEALAGGCGVAFPAVLGHEGAGVVESVGPGVRGLRKGDSVVLCFLPFCARCRCCRSGKGNMCEAQREASTPPRSKPRLSTVAETGASLAAVHQFLGCSTFSEYTVVSELQLARVNGQAPPGLSCLLGCSAATGLGAVFNVAAVEDGTTAAVFGINTAGLAVIEALRVSNASRIVALDLDAGRLAQAREWGATHCINLADLADAPSILIRRLIGDGVDYAFDCVGSQAVSRAAIESSQEGWGTTVLLSSSGEPPSGASAVTITHSQLLRGKRIKGALLGGYRGRAEIPLLVERYLAGDFRLDGLVRRSVPLAMIHEAVNHAQAAQDASRVIIRYAA